MPAITIAFLLLLLVAMPALNAHVYKPGLLLTIPRQSLYRSAVVSQWVVALVCLLVLWIEAQGGETPVLSKPIGAKATLLWTGVTLVGALLVVAGVALIRRLTGRRESVDVVHIMPRDRDDWLSFLLLVAPTAGFVEELLYRAYIVTRLEPVVGNPWLAAGIGCIAFALGHIYQDALGIGRAAVLGMVLAAPYVLSGSLLPSMLAHALVDVLIPLGGQWLFGPDADDDVDGDTGDDADASG